MFKAFKANFSNLYLENQFVYYLLFYKILSDKLVNYLESIKNSNVSLEVYLKDKSNFNDLKSKSLNHLHYFLKEEYFFHNIFLLYDDFHGDDGAIVEKLLNGFNYLKQTVNESNSPFNHEFNLLLDDINYQFPKNKWHIVGFLMKFIIKLDFSDNSYSYGDVFEEVIRWDSNKSLNLQGDITTVNEINELICKLVKVSKYSTDSIYDPFLGSGSLLFNLAKNLNVKKIHGQEQFKEIYKLSLMNFIIYNLNVEYAIFNNDSLIDYPETEKFDVVISQVPFNSKRKVETYYVNLPDSMLNLVDGSFRLSEWVYIMFLLNNLKKTGIMVVVVPTSVLSNTLKLDNKIRKYLIDKSYLDTVIDLPEKLLHYSRIPLSILIFKKECADDILFIDATKEFEAQKRFNKLRNQNIIDIIDIYSNRKIIPKKSNIVENNEIKQNNYNLSLSRYVDTYDKEFINLYDELNKLNTYNQYLNLIDKYLEKKLNGDSMVHENEHPIVFLSYARTNPQYSEKIVNFANMLRKDGIDARIDEWDLKAGQDIYYFMENMIKFDADFILLMLNEEFVKKSNRREGGVGTETQIIAKDIYANVQQEKVIPIVWESDGHGNPCLPTFLESRYYFDFSSDDKFGENYGLLLRTLYNKPKNPKEELGEMPAWLNDTNTYYSALDSIIKQFDYQVDNHPEKFNFLIEEFFSEYFEYLKSFKINFKNFDKKSISNEIYENLEKYSLLKEHFVIFLEKVFKTSKYQKFDSEIIIEFLSNIRSILSQNETYEVANFDFILRETFLYFIAYGLKYKNYSFIADLFYSSYYFDDYLDNSSKYYVNLDMRGYIDTNNILTYSSENGVSPLGELLIKRVPVKIGQDLLIDADLLCCYVSYMNFEKFNSVDWFPYTLIYKKRNSSFYLFRRLSSKKFFNSIKEIFDVETIDEFKAKVISTRNLPLGQGDVMFPNPMFGKVKPIEEYIDLSKIGNDR